MHFAFKQQYIVIYIYIYIYKICNLKKVFKLYNYIMVLYKNKV